MMREAYERQLILDPEMLTAADGCLSVPRMLGCKRTMSSIHYEISWNISNEIYSFEHLGDSDAQYVNKLFKFLLSGIKFILGTASLELIEALEGFARLLGRLKNRRKPSNKNLGSLWYPNFAPKRLLFKGHGLNACPVHLLTWLLLKRRKHLWVSLWLGGPGFFSVEAAGCFFRRFFPARSPFARRLTSWKELQDIITGNWLKKQYGPNKTLYVTRLRQAMTNIISLSYYHIHDHCPCYYALRTF